FKRIPVNLSDGAPVCAHLRNDACRQIHLVQAFEHVLAIDIAGCAVIEDEHQARQAGQRGGAKMREVGNPGHLDFDRYCNLALDLFGTAAGPLRDDLNVIVGYVRIGLDGQVFERDNTPCREHKHATENQPAIFEREINECSNHYWFPAASSKRACVTTCLPGSMPDRICWRL